MVPQTFGSDGSAFKCSSQKRFHVVVFLKLCCAIWDKQRQPDGFYHFAPCALKQTTNVRRHIFFLKRLHEIWV